MSDRKSPNIQAEIANILSEFDTFLDNVFEASLTSPSFDSCDSAAKLDRKPSPKQNLNVINNRFPIEQFPKNRPSNQDKSDLNVLVLEGRRNSESDAIFTDSSTKNIKSYNHLNEPTCLLDNAWKKKDDVVIYDNVKINDYNKIDKSGPISNASDSQNTKNDGKHPSEESKLSKFKIHMTKDGKSKNKEVKIDSSPELKVKKDKNKTEHSMYDKFGSLQKLFCTTSSKVYSDSDDKPKLTKPSTQKLSKDQISYPVLNETTFHGDLANVRSSFIRKEENNPAQTSDASYPLKSYKAANSSQISTVSTDNFQGSPAHKSKQHAVIDSNQIKKFDILLKEFHHSDSHLKCIENKNENSVNFDYKKQVFQQISDSPKEINHLKALSRSHPMLCSANEVQHIIESPPFPRNKKLIFERNAFENNKLKDQKDDANLDKYLHHLLTTHSAKIAAGIMSVEHRGTKALELWTKRVTEGYERVGITNMTTSWRDGLAFCALIHHFRPDLIDFKALKPENILENNALAFRVAEQHLGIPALLDAEDMVETEIPDRLSILTYVSQFYQAFNALGLIGPGGRRSPVSPTVTNNAKNTSITTSNSPNKQSPIIASPRAKTISQPPATLQTKTETGFKTDKVTMGARGRREECVACHKQVFLAERIVVGFPGQLRHRTCFRCDRCAGQLTLASYYETEKGQFCCETCPDEERIMSSGEEDEATENKKANYEKSEKEESSCDSESDSDSQNPSDLEENSPYRKNKKSVTPPPPTPRTVFLNDSLESPRSSIEFGPPTKPPRTSVPSTIQKNNFSQLSPALCGNIKDPSMNNSTTVSPSPFSCEDAKGQETCPPGDALDTGQLVRTSSKNSLKDKIDQTLESNAKIDNTCHTTNDKENIPENKVKDLRSIFEQKKDSTATTEINTVKSEYSLNNQISTNESSKNVNTTRLTLGKSEDNDSSIDVPDDLNVHDSKESLNVTDSCMDRLETPNKEISVHTSQEDSSDKEISVNISHEETRSIDLIVDDVSKPSLNDNNDDPSISNNSKLNIIEEPVVVSSESPVVQGDSDDAQRLESNPETETSNDVAQRLENNPETETSKDVDQRLKGNPETETSNDVAQRLESNPETETSNDVAQRLENNPETETSKDVDQRLKGNSETETSKDVAQRLESNLETETSKDVSSDIQEKEVSKVEYPDELNPFGSDEENDVKIAGAASTTKMQESTPIPTKRLKNKIETTPFNPFDTDEEDEDEEKKQIEEKSEKENSKKKSLNPFWSDEESDYESLPSKNKVKPPRPPPPTLRWETSPGMKKYILPSNPYENRNQREFPPPSPSLSARSSSSDQSTLRIKKKLRQAPAPPPAGCSPSVMRNTSLSTVIGADVAGDIKDDALTAKMQKDLLNHTNKLKGDAANQKEEQMASALRGGISTPKCEKGEWRRKKGPAPSRPVPQKRAIRKLPMRQVAQELSDIEVKQTELERQGVLLETAIRERTESPSFKLYASDSASPEDSISTSSEPEKSFISINSSSTCSTHPSLEVEDMILQLFELVNEKNELFRRQTELMYLKREKRLEEEYAELEYQIRCLMFKPMAEKSEDDKKIEEELIGRLVKVVEQRDAVVNCLEMERQREAIEDESIATHMIKYQEKHIEGIIESDEGKGTLKKKKKLRLLKKKKKGKTKEKASKVDADKDVDETEIKKKKKNWFKKAALGGSN